MKCRPAMQLVQGSEFEGWSTNTLVIGRESFATLELYETLVLSLADKFKLHSRSCVFA